jgi:hypothetical protein
MNTIRRVTAVLVVLLGIPVLALAQSNPMQPQRPGMGPGQLLPAPPQPPGSDLGGLQGRSGDVPPPSRGIPGPSQPPQAYSVPDQQRHWGGQSPDWDRHGGRRPGWERPPGYYDPYYPPNYPNYPYYPYPAARAVWVPGHWVWTGYTWAWQPGYWARY